MMAMMTMISEPRRPRAVRRCGRLLHMSHAAWSLCVLYTRMSCAETDEPIEMLPRVGPRNAVIDAVQIARARVARRDMCHRHSTVHARWPRAAHHSGYALRRCGPIPNYSGHLLLSCGRSAYVPRGGGKWTAVGAT